ncbi:MAG: indolepyruvate oxidoreductase subunit beta family protein [Steroidobacteraceae bacterium]
MPAIERNRLCIAVLALGGQGGGVLAAWIEELARRHGWSAQGTSVPGVAQRTGSTVYYVELAPPGTGDAPIMASMPVPGDVDIVIASELMEIGRAMLRGLVSADRTVLIGSTHRVYAIAEKSAMGDGRGRGERVLESARERAKRFIGFDMEAATERSGSVISAVMFGALAGSGVLPFPKPAFEAAIRASGIAVAENLAGFLLGFDTAQRGEALAADQAAVEPQPTTEAGRALAGEVRATLPAAAHRFALLGVQRLMDYQDGAYARLYLSRLREFGPLDRDGALTAELARHLALWMSYEDTIRVADLKTRGSRFERVRDEVHAGADQVLRVTEFMHPRLEEVCDTLPAALGARILGSPRLSGWLGRGFRAGRHVETSRLRWFLALRLVAGMRRFRRSTLRYRIETARIEQWLGEIRAFARQDVALALEWARCQRLVKGYGDTFERGLHNLESLRRALAGLPAAQRTPGWLQAGRDAALADDAGKALAAFLSQAPAAPRPGSAAAG